MEYKFLIDSDVIIWYLKGNKKAYSLIHNLNGFCISAITYMELVQGMKDKNELRLFQRKLKEWDIKIIYINEEISIKAMVYVEDFYLSHSVELADSMIAATSMSYGTVLITANDKHYKMINGLEINIFRP